MSTAQVVAVTAGLSQPSSSRLLADRLTQAVGNALGERGLAVESSVIELREHARELTNHLLTGFPAPSLAAVLRRVGEADALIAVSPIFSASYSGLFKTFFDVLEPDGLRGKPVLIGATGGTARHSLALEYALRPLFTYLHAVVVPTAVFAAPEDWASENVLAGRLASAAAELAGLISQAPAARAGHGAEESGEVVPFERLLGRSVGPRMRGSTV
jgi:FMN reductase